jgi:hypothetical protein
MVLEAGARGCGSPPASEFLGMTLYIKHRQTPSEHTLVIPVVPVHVHHRQMNGTRQGQIASRLRPSSSLISYSCVPISILLNAFRVEVITRKKADPLVMLGGCSNSAAPTEPPIS